MHANPAGFRVGLRHNVADLPLAGGRLGLAIRGGVMYVFYWFESYCYLPAIESRVKLKDIAAAAKMFAPEQQKPLWTRSEPLARR